jgi:hypothetical protein
MPHLRKTEQKSKKAFIAMDCTLTGRHTDFRCIRENALDSIHHNNESD